MSLPSFWQYCQCFSLLLVSISPQTILPICANIHHTCGYTLPPSLSFFQFYEKILPTLVNITSTILNSTHQLLKKTSINHYFFFPNIKLILFRFFCFFTIMLNSFCFYFFVDYISDYIRLYISWFFWAQIFYRKSLK